MMPRNACIDQWRPPRATPNNLVHKSGRMHAIDFTQPTMTDTPITPSAPATATPATPLPDRLSIDPRSPHHVAAVFEHDVGIRINGKDRFDVEEYCVSEGWIKVASGKTVDRKGKPLLITIKGKVEAFYR
jgi:hypothetical protein